MEQTDKHLILMPDSLSLSPYHFILLVHIYVVLEWNLSLAHAVLRLFTSSKEGQRVPSAPDPAPDLSCVAPGAIQQVGCCKLEPDG